MKLQPRCIPCLQNRIFSVIHDKDEQMRILCEFLPVIAKNIGKGTPAVRVALLREAIVKKILKNKDLWQEFKRESTELAAESIPLLEEKMQNSRDKFRTALKIAAVANAIEFGVPEREYPLDELRKEIEKPLGLEFAVDDTEEFSRRVMAAKRILIFIDNAGEHVLDRFLIEQLKSMGKGITLAARCTPFMNNATADDLKAAGYAKIAKITCWDSYDLGDMPADFAKELNAADLVLAIGIMNYEILSEQERRFAGRLVYLLRAKCAVIAEAFDVERGSIVLKAV